jgi:hypothetical protein
MVEIGRIYTCVEAKFGFMPCESLASASESYTSHPDYSDAPWFAKGRFLL